MAIFFTSGEKKKRAGIYQRYENVGTPPVAGANDGVVAAVVRSSWGVLGKVQQFESYEAVKEFFGPVGAEDTYSYLEDVFNGGAKLVHVVRMGQDGSKGELMIMDNEGMEAEPKNLIKVSTKYNSTRQFKVTIQDALGDPAKKELILYENNVVLEKIEFPAGSDHTNEVEEFLEIANQKSAYLDFEKVDGAEGTKLGCLSEAEIIGGANPVVTNEDYSKAFSLLEIFTWNALVLDTYELSTQMLAYNYMKRIYKDGRMGFLVMGEPVSVPFETRIMHAKSFNDYQVVYVGSGYILSTDEKIDGVRAAGRVAGMLAGFPSNQSLTHKVINGAVDTIEKLTNYQYEQAIENGMVTFSVSSKGLVWVEAGITTLVTPTGEDDEGWKKIKRTKVRFELMQRVSDTVETLIGQINNDSDGRATVMQAVRGVLNAMVVETKILPGATIELDAGNPPVGDSAWFVIAADDIDALEKMYFTYRFRYAAID